MPNLFVLLDIGRAYRRYADELLICHRDLLRALHNFEQHWQLSQVFVFSENAAEVFCEETMQLVLSQSMHYLHAYFAVFAPQPLDTACPVRKGLLLAAILGLTLKVLTQDYVLEHLPIRE